MQGSTLRDPGAVLSLSIGAERIERCNAHAPKVTQVPT
jgi:hypothetical protein